MSLEYDYHVHSNYSDGRQLERMVEAAADAGLDGVGFADHCNVSEREDVRREKYRLGFNLDRTYERRRRAIDSLAERRDLRIFDAVEMDYDPREEALVGEFLSAAAFDYAIGSVHYLEGVNVHDVPHFGEKSEDEREALVEEYFEHLRALVDSELFDVAAHVDVIERNPALRGFATRDHYERVAEAFARSRTVPEVNAGRIHDEYAEFHPASAFTDVLLDRGIEFTVGSDAHAPDEVRERTPELEAAFERRGIDPVHVVE
ncbi:MAG: PHP domain-containing protein [Salinigranum sp.]